MPRIAKAYAITDAKISFVSLVNKAANKKQFLITKSENGAANFATFGRILKADADSHFVTGIVYEPMVEEYPGQLHDGRRNYKSRLLVCQEWKPGGSAALF